MQDEENAPSTPQGGKGHFSLKPKKNYGQRRSNITIRQSFI